MCMLMDDIESATQYTYYLPHVPPANAWQVFAGVSNLELNETADIVQTTYELDGDRIDQTHQTRFSLLGGASTSIEFPGTAQRWVKLVSSRELAGLLTFSLDRGRGIEKAALPLMSATDLNHALVFPHVPSDRSQFWSGAAYFNPQDVPVTYDVTLYSSGYENLNTLLNPSFSRLCLIFN